MEVSTGNDFAGAFDPVEYITQTRYWSLVVIIANIFPAVICFSFWGLELKPYLILVSCLGTRTCFQNTHCWGQGFLWSFQRGWCSDGSNASCYLHTEYDFFICQFHDYRPFGTTPFSTIHHWLLWTPGRLWGAIPRSSTRPGRQRGLRFNHASRVCDSCLKSQGCLRLFGFCCGPWPPKPTEIDRNCLGIHLRLTVNEVLRCKPGSTVLLAPCCKSFSRMSGRWKSWLVNFTIVRCCNQPGFRSLKLMTDKLSRL